LLNEQAEVMTMDANISEANKRLAATCEQLDDIETKLAVLFEEIETHASLFSEA
jgi:hypothetical protein